MQAMLQRSDVPLMQLNVTKRLQAAECLLEQEYSQVRTFASCPWMPFFHDLHTFIAKVRG
jgi:hypothetical protein